MALTNVTKSSCLDLAGVVDYLPLNKHVCIHEIMQLIIMKMKTKMKIDSRKYGINRPRQRHGHKYSKYMKRLSMMMLICIKQHLSNI